jgi:hypothetical protein
MALMMRGWVPQRQMLVMLNFMWLQIKQTVTIKTMEIGRTAVLGSLLGSFVLVGVVFYVFTLLVSKVNPKLVNILSRIMGLFLMAIAIEMIAKGIHYIAIIFSYLITILHTIIHTSPLHILSSLQISFLR